MIYSPEDRTICETLLKSAKGRGDRVKPLSELVLTVGRHFLGAPYEPDTLEREGSEELVVNLRAFDCVTFVENAIVLAGLKHSGKTAFADYTASLEKIRYRRGRCSGYASRLHYFTDWLYDNGRKGLVQDMTREIGGIPYRKTFHWLADRREDHPGLKDPTAFRRLRIVEATCSRRPLFFIPKASLEKAEDQMRDGDIIAMTTNERGLDVSHTGLAVRLRGQIHLLHASSAAGRVVLSDITLNRYLATQRSRTGIIIGRACRPDIEKKAKDGIR
jgi:hypothetical protein